MPIHEYFCEKCGTRIEVIQKFGATALKRCRKCRGKLEKLVSRSGFQLKGSGWYQTDYSNKSQTSSKDSSKDTAEPSKDTAEKSVEKKTDSAPASDTKPPATVAD